MSLLLAVGLRLRGSSVDLRFTGAPLAPFPRISVFPKNFQLKFDFDDSHLGCRVTFSRAPPGRRLQEARVEAGKDVHAVGPPGGQKVAREFVCVVRKSRDQRPTNQNF
ncbi:hypothetical protein OJAV_G00218610 [Oryzias javanicus]|uniref:Uncharacterized protein n=1 Tax=Oryzias javanicus TaxID=123683 RepID=A0A437C4Z0_ORYJA|nr:hypothetical protein OJAV_G00218610 [Oryzias javanicus]